MESVEPWVVVGKIVGLYGVKGWVRVYSYTDPAESIFEYGDWTLCDAENQRRSCAIAEGKPHGNGLVARIEGVADRDVAAAFVGCTISVPRSQLPELETGEVYWADLEGLHVVTQAGVELGRVSHLFETGANDVIVVQGDRERLIPYVKGTVVTEIDLVNRVLRVNWDPEF